MTTSAVRRNLLQARRELSEELERKHLLVVAAVVVIAVLPVIGGPWLPVRAVAALLLYAIAVVGLNFVMGLGNMASIGHGAFVAIGALVATLMRTKLSVGFPAAVIVATVATAGAAVFVGYGAIRLRAVHLALSSWLGAWLAALFLVSFPAISGGASGLPVPQAAIGDTFGFEWRLTTVAFYEIALGALVLVLVLFRSMQRSSVGLTLATIKQNPREASVIGTLRDDVRLKLFVFGSSVAGFSGALLVHLTGIFDHRSFGVLLSVSLFLAVLIGGPGRTFGPVAGAAVIALLPIGGQPLIPFYGSGTRAGELVAGGLLLAAVALRASSGSSVAPARTSRRGDVAPPDAGIEPTRLEVRGVTKRFGGLVALDEVDLLVEAGRIHGVMGPNGSGKSTLLAVVSGHLFPDSGAVLLDDEDVTRLPAVRRVALGISRSLQSTELFPHLTALDHLDAASLVDRRYGGFVRALTRTPRARQEERLARARAVALLEEFGLSGVQDETARHIPSGARRLLMMAIAVAGRRVVLLDEPSAGMSPAEVRRAAGIILELKERGATVIVVEHNMRLLMKVAGDITVLDGGRVIARGEPGHIYDHPDVRAAYLGSKGGSLS